MPRIPSRVAVLAAGLVAWASIASATLVEVNQSSTTGFTVSNSDLLNGLLPSVNNANLIRSEEGNTTNNPAALTDGAFGIPGIPNQGDSSHATEVVAIHNGAVLTYTLPVNPLGPNGWNISAINVYTGWRDSGRDDQDYSVLYSLVASPTSFVSLAAVAYDPGLPSPSDTAVLLSDSSGGFLIRGVAALQFSFPTTENGYVGYRELDVFGTAETPEPSTMLLTVLGLGSLGRYLRRRRTA